MRHALQAVFALAITLSFVACPTKPGGGSSSSSSGGSGSSGTSGNAGFDAGVVSNACLRDQECSGGKICGGDAGCLDGLGCQQSTECDCEEGSGVFCGFTGRAYCDTAAHVCRRILSSCEPCSSDEQCGENMVAGVNNHCINYGGGQKFCGLACQGSQCSQGFQCSALAGGSCTGGPAECGCRVAEALVSCQGALPCMADVECPTGKHCTTREANPPRRGVCLAFCLADDECPSGKICQLQPGPNFGVCIQGCTPGQTGANGTICHAWGRLGNVCPTVACPTGYECSTTASGYCKLPGCQSDAQCPLSRTICDIPSATCVPGCRTATDCGAFELCTGGQCVSQGCRGKDLSCNMGQFCCGKELYDPTSSGGLACPAGVDAGVCFNMTDPFCRRCTDDDSCANITSFGQVSHCYELQTSAADGGTASMGKFCSVGCRTTNDCPRGLVCRDLPAGQNGETVKGCLENICASFAPPP